MRIKWISIIITYPGIIFDSQESYKDGTEGFYGWIKNKSKDVFGDIVDGIVGVFRHIFDGLFNGDGGLKHTLNIFFLSTLPDVIFQSGLVLMKGFGAKVEQVTG